MSIGRNVINIAQPLMPHLVPLHLEGVLCGIIDGRGCDVINGRSFQKLLGIVDHVVGKDTSQIKVFKSMRRPSLSRHTG